MPPHDRSGLVTVHATRWGVGPNAAETYTCEPSGARACSTYCMLTVSNIMFWGGGMPARTVMPREGHVRFYSVGQ